MPRWLQHVFDADISAFDPYVEDSIIDAFGVKRADNLRDMLSESDIVSLHIPDHARHLIGKAELQLSN